LAASFIKANLRWANLFRTNLIEANLSKADLSRADLSEANLTRANLIEADLDHTNLKEADLSGADLRGASLLETDFSGANLTDCSIYGISAWDSKLEGATQLNLRITPPYESAITVDNLEIAQFVYLLLNNEKIRDVIDTIGRKGVLLLERFTDGRITILERLREELRKRGFVPMVFNFDKPDTKDFTETVRLLAGLSHFVIVDITNPRSAPLELQATVPECMVPFVPILEKGEEPFAMLSDLWIKHREWVLDPIRYPSLDRLVEVLDAEIVRPAEVRFTELLKRKAETLRVKDI
jgi:Pentapeptide repeats (8 copies)